MAVTQIDIDDDALDRAMALSKTRTKKDAVNLALRYYAERQERPPGSAGILSARGTGGQSRTRSGCTRPRRTPGDLPARHFRPGPAAA
jgi:Arc/MetJ family transcription regulator